MDYIDSKYTTCSSHQDWDYKTERIDLYQSIMTTWINRHDLNQTWTKKIGFDEEQYTSQLILPPCQRRNYHFQYPLRNIRWVVWTLHRIWGCLIKASTGFSYSSTTYSSVLHDVNCSQQAMRAIPASVIHHIWSLKLCIPLQSKMSGLMDQVIGSTSVFPVWASRFVRHRRQRCLKLGQLDEVICWFKACIISVRDCCIFPLAGWWGFVVLHRVFSQEASNFSTINLGNNDHAIPTAHVDPLTIVGFVQKGWNVGSWARVLCWLNYTWPLQTLWFVLHRAAGTF